MASKKGGKCKRSYYRAQLATNIKPCAFCQRAVDDELIYGKLYDIGDIQCHYFCALLSCCLIQKGSDEEGLFGFLYPDIIAEVERCKKHKCSYCNREGANLGCTISQCRKQFHLPCGREKNAVSLFYGNYKSFCAHHAPKQKITDAVSANVKLRIAQERRKVKTSQTGSGTTCNTQLKVDDAQSIAEAVCVICYETVQGYPTTQTFWPPCCARDAWFHRSCLQRMALSAGMHYLKCPLCNDKENFYRAVLSQGYYVPDRDAAWELEQNAFAEIYERPVACCAESCKCPNGRDHDCETGPWDIKLCILCGTTAIHVGCTDSTEELKIYICYICQPAAPSDLENLIKSIESVQLQEQAVEAARHGPVMSSRMSLRRTKPRSALNPGPSTSRMMPRKQIEAETPDSKTTESCRLELNLKKPRRRIFDPIAKNIENTLLSPIKMLEQGLSEKMALFREEVELDSSKVMEKLREKFRKPKPLVVKKRIVNNILEELLSNILKERKVKEATLEWNSPKKICDVQNEDSKENIVNTTPAKSTIQDKSTCNDIESVKKIKSPRCHMSPHFKTTNTNEDYKCNYKHKHLDQKSSVSKLRTAIDFAIDAVKANENNLKRKLSFDSEIDSKKRKVDEDSVFKDNTTKSDCDLLVDFDLPEKELKLKKENNETDVRNKVRFNISLKRKDSKNVDSENSKSKNVDSENSKSKNVDSENSKSKNVDSENSKSKNVDSENSKVDVEETAKDSKKNIVSRKNAKVKQARKKNNFSLKRKVTNKTADSNLESEQMNSTKGSTQNADNVKDTKLNSTIQKKKLTLKIKSPKKVVNTERNDKIDLVDNTEGKIDLDKVKLEKDLRMDKKKNVTYQISNVNDERGSDVIDMTLNSKEVKLNYKKKHKKKLSIRDRDIKVKIRWKKQQLKLKITEKTKKKPKVVTPKVLKQYVLKYSPELSPNEVIVKPEKDLTPVKRKYIKKEKQAESLVQTNISSFFKVAPKNKDNT